MDYLAFFGLSSEPFSNAPVGRFYYDSAQHSQALVRLRFALASMKGLALCVGDIGAGKTTLARRLLDSLDEDQFEAALLVILHRDITADWLLRRIAFQLGVETPSKDKLILLSQLYRRLLAIYEAGRKAVVLIDEAQMLASRDLMEEFRGLLNLEVPGQKLLSFVFFGLPTLEQNLGLDPPLEQRVALRVRLGPLDPASTDAYIRHRLRVAGATRHVFRTDAVALVHRASSGVPRVVNTVCDNAMLEASLANEALVGPERVEQVVRELGLSLGDEQPSALPTPLPSDRGPDTNPTAEIDSALDEIDRVLASLAKLT